MLSATNTITDVKARLRNTYSYYSFTDDAAFISALTIAGGDTQRLDMIPLIGSSEYVRIAAKDKTDLTTVEESIYFGEVYFIMARFLQQIDAETVQSIKGSSHSQSVGDVSESISNGTNVSGYRAAASRYYKTGREYLIQAGFGMMQLSRCGTPVAEEFNINARY